MNVQVSFEYFANTYRLIQRFRELQELDAETVAIAEALEKEFKVKIDKMIKRELYSTYKTAETAEEREKARLQYLEKIGLNPDWKW